MGSSNNVVVGSAADTSVNLSLTRQVGQLELIVDGLVDEVSNVTLTMNNLCNQVSLAGNFSGNVSETIVSKTNNQTSDTIKLVAFPTTSGQNSALNLVITLEDGTSFTYTTLPTQQIKANTLYKLSATVNSSDWTSDLKINVALDTLWTVKNEGTVDL